MIDDDSLSDVGAVRSAAISILLIEDEALVRMVVADDLREQGYRVVEGSSAEEGRQFMLADEPIALVITDVNLPGKSGVEFAAWLRVEFPDVGIVLTSGVHENAVAARPFGKFLPKPFDLEQLSELIKPLLPA